MRSLVLVKHSLPDIDPTLPPTSWRLSAEGSRRCTGLAQRIATHAPAALVTSTEPKATDTASLVGHQLGLDIVRDDRLREHERDETNWLGQDAFEASVAELFARPGARVFGRESGRQALRRFSAGVDDALRRVSLGTVVVVAHGTVISLFAADRSGVDGFALWKRLGMPSYIVLRRPDFRPLEEVATMPSHDRNDADEVPL